MKPNETVTVIVPVYNTARFLKKCIESIIRQTYSNLQIILVNDGSTDSSLDFCEYYAKKDTRILLLSQENYGVSVARNYAMEHMIGKYVTFVDSDDWLSKDAVETLLNLMHDKDAEYVVGNMYRFEPVISSSEDIKNLTIECNSNTEDVKRFFGYMGYYAHVAKKMLVTKIIKENHIMFPLNIKCGEDSCFMLDYLFHCNRVCSTSDIVYYNNRLFQNTGGTKYYPERHIWAKEVLERYDKCLRHYMDDENVKDYLSREAIYQNNIIVIRHLTCGESTEIIAGRVNETYKFIRPFVTENYLDKHINEDSVKRFRMIEDIMHTNKYMSFISSEVNNISFLGIAKKHIRSVIVWIKYLWKFRIRVT